MILSGGELDGKRYLKPETVKLMTTVQTGDLKTGFTPGNGWGLGWCVVREPQGVTAMLSPGTFGHGGAYGTQAWIDPGKKRDLHPDGPAGGPPQLRRLRGPPGVPGGGEFRPGRRRAVQAEPPFAEQGPRASPRWPRRPPPGRRRKTAIIVCDMWDDHWCKSAARRVGETGRADERDAQGGPRPGRVRHPRAEHLHRLLQGHAAAEAGAAGARSPRRRCRSSTTERWGTAWYWPDGKREGVLPIDDSDMGCDCKVKCEIRDAVDAADRRDRDRRGRRDHRRRPGGVEPARRAAGSTTSSSAAST